MAGASQQEAILSGALCTLRVQSPCEPVGLFAYMVYAFGLASGFQVQRGEGRFKVKVFKQEHKG